MQVKTKMTEDQVQRFLRKVMTNKEIKFNVNMFSDNSVNAFGARISIAKDNKSFNLQLNTELATDIRCLLLHEIGHLEGEHNHSSSISENELSAQLWGIRRAKELGWEQISKEMKRHLEVRWVLNYNSSYKWNSPYRIYILAHRLAKKRGLIKS